MTTDQDLKELSRRWTDFCHHQGWAEESAATFGRLAAAYAAPDRHYHNGRHILQCLRELDGVRGHCLDPDAVESAIWFHDVVYDSTRSDNEERSTDLAKLELDALGAAESFISKVETLITATKHTGPPPAGDSELLVDIDLSILGQPTEVFDAYESAIRAEYAWVSAMDFERGRAKVLRGFLDRAEIYRTTGFRDRYETTARENLRRSLEELGVH